MMRLKTALICGALMGAALPVRAEETDVGDAVSVELNAARPGEEGCTLSFLVINGHAAPIEKLVYETVLFDGSGQVERLTLFDFGDLPPARPRVRQFAVPGIACDGMSRILINGAETCEAPDLAASACIDGLTTHSRTEIELRG